MHVDLKDLNNEQVSIVIDTIEACGCTSEEVAPLFGERWRLFGFRFHNVKYASVALNDLVTRCAT